MENQIDNIQKDDEISLVDLFAVLIRYRKLILIITLVGALLAGLYLFVLPMVKPVENNVNSIIYTVNVNRVPLSVEKSLKNISSKNTLSGEENMVLDAFLNDVVELPIFASVYEDYPFLSANGQLPSSDVETNSMIKSFIDGKKMVLTKNPLKSDVKISMEVAESNVDLANNFMTELIKKVDQGLMDYILPLLENLQRETSEKLLVMESHPSFRGESAAELHQMLLDLDSYLASLESFALMEVEPFVTVTTVASSTGNTTKFIIVVFAAFFISVFIAFVLNAIKNIKEDPTASKVISEAWKAGK